MCYTSDFVSVASELWPRNQHTWSDMLNYIAYEAKRKVKSGLHRFPILLLSPSSPASYNLLLIKWSNHAISWKSRFTNQVHQDQTRLKNMPFRNHYNYNITTILPKSELMIYLKHFSLVTFPTCTSFIFAMLFSSLLFFSCSIWVIWIADLVKWHFLPCGKK